MSNTDNGCRYLEQRHICHATLYLFVLLHGCIQLLGEVIRHVGHARLLLVGSAQAALILARFLAVLLLGVLAVSFCSLELKNSTFIHQ